MKILYLTSNFPSLKKEAVERVNLEIINELIKKGHEVYLQVVFSENMNFKKDINEKISTNLSNKIKILPPLVNNFKFKRLFSYLRILFPSKKNIYPSYIHKERIQNILNENNIRLIFQSWDYPGVAAVNEIKNVKKILYYGQPDHKPNLSRLADEHLFYEKKNILFNIKKFFIKRYNKKKEKLHLMMIKNFDEINIICKAAQQDYINAGIKNAKYTQNIWPLETDEEYYPIKEKICKIVGSVGSNDATGNTINFHYIGNKLINDLNKIKNFNYKINFYGKNKPLNTVSKLFYQNNIHFNGWVEDLDNEVKSSDIFLICHNSIYQNRYLKCNDNKWQLGGCHTRFLYAWSIGCPVVTHSANKIYMPEIEHGYNALMGDNSIEISEYIKKLYDDVDLRKKLVSNGRATLKKYFIPSIVVNKIFKNIKND